MLCTVHQPSAAAFALFDSLLLLNDGRSVYFGAAVHAARYFGDLQLHAAPFDPDEPGANPADYVVTAAAGGGGDAADDPSGGGGVGGLSAAAKADAARALSDAYRRSTLREPFGLRNYRSAILEVVRSVEGVRPKRPVWHVVRVRGRRHTVFVSPRRRKPRGTPPRKTTRRVRIRGRGAARGVSTFV